VLALLELLISKFMKFFTNYRMNNKKNEKIAKNVLLLSPEGQ